MIVDDTHVEYFNNQLYVHICTFKYRGELVYYFSNLYKQLLCTKINGVYQPITDNYKYWLYRNVFGLVNTSKTYTLTESITNKSILKKIMHITRVALYGKEETFRYEKGKPLLKDEEEKYKAELLDSLEEIKEKFHIDLDMQKCQKRLREYVSYSRMHSSDLVGGGTILGSIILLPDKAREDTIEGKHVRIHEGIHTITGNKLYLYALAFSTGLVEAETENLTHDYLNFKGSTKRVLSKNLDNSKEQVYNLSLSTSYKEMVCLLKQMEVALGKKSYESILKGNLSFEKDFIKQYGLIPFIKLTASIELMKYIALFTDEPLRHNMSLMSKTQDYLLKTVFNKDLKKVQTPQDAVEFLRKLRNFDTVRMRETKYVNGQGMKENTTYEQYYREMYSKVKQKLLSIGYKEEQVAKTLEGLEYKKQRFDARNIEPEEEIEKCANILLWMNEKGLQINPDECSFIKANDLDGEGHYFLVSNGKVFQEKVIEDPGGEGVRITLEQQDYETAKEAMEAQDLVVSKVDLDREAFKDRVKEISLERLRREQQWKERQAKEKEQQEQGLTPYKRNIFQKLWDRIKETFNRRKDEKEPEQPQDAFEKTEQKKEEERRPSWDLRNWGMTRASLQKQQPTQTQARNIENQRNVSVKPRDDGPEK